MSNDKVTIKIPRPLYKKIKKMIKGTGFSSVTEFIVYVMRGVVAGKVSKENKLTEKEIRIIKQRLKALGYI